jgi:Co/Zn/Cd efflux system component
MSKAKRLWLVLLANVSMVLALVIVGLVSHSLGFLAAGGDYLGDAAGVALALLALLALRIIRERGDHARASTYVTDATKLAT